MSGYNPAVQELDRVIEPVTDENGFLAIGPGMLNPYGLGAETACNGTIDQPPPTMEQIAAMLATPTGNDQLPHTITVATYNNENIWFGSSTVIATPSVWYHQLTVTGTAQSNGTYTVAGTNSITQQVFSYEGEMVTLEEFWELKDLTPEQRQAWFAARRAEWDKITLDRHEANRRAWNTLVDFLTDEQIFTLEFCDYFDVEVNDRLYRIDRVRRVQRLDPKTRRSLSLYCIVPASGCLPDYDVMLGKKLLLEADEKRFLKTANEERCSGWYPVEGIEPEELVQNDHRLQLAA